MRENLTSGSMRGGWRGLTPNSRTRSGPAAYSTSSSGAISLLRGALRQLREEARAGSDGAALTGLLREAFTCRNEFDATLTALVGELDRVERARPDGEGERS